MIPDQRELRVTVQVRLKNGQTYRQFMSRWVPMPPHTILEAGKLGLSGALDQAIKEEPTKANHD